MPDNFDLYGLTDEQLEELEELKELEDTDEGGYDPWLLEDDFDDL